MPRYISRIPDDPFNDEPLQSKRDGKDRLLYSVGPHLKDDGGMSWEDSQKPGDLVFRLHGR